MCGRYTINVTYEDMKTYLHDNYHIDDFDAEFKLPRYNVAPGQNILSVINDGTKNRAGLLKWGFVPFFAKDENMGSNLINAKAETLLQKPSFKDSFKNKRCIILADSFYEWAKTGFEKIPMRVMLNDQSLFAMAGLWSSYTRPDRTKLYTCTIITTEANDLVAKVHDRMPVILTNETARLWLDPKNSDLQSLAALLVPFDPAKMTAFRVSSAVSNAKNDDPSLIKAI
ncbi:MAG TPA: hypothetical protein DD618_04945 [Acholeplasmatales bacterium]|nr:hypothetical protein [Acholeplasmatales bacterium]